MREDKPGDGVVFVNKYKTDGDKKPALKGHIFHWSTGERIEIAMWPHKTGGGYSIKCSEPRSLGEEIVKTAPTKSSDGFDVPF